MNHPLQDCLRKLRDGGMDWVGMADRCEHARSHSWLKNMVDHGAWGQVRSGRVGPPTPGEFPGLAKLLGTTPQAVAEMVAADFYGVDTTRGYSARVQRIAPAVDGLDDQDAHLVEQLVARLSGPPREESTTSAPETETV